MGIKLLLSLVMFLCLLKCSSEASKTVIASQKMKHTYIVHVSTEQMPSTYTVDSDWYHSSLRSVSSDYPEILYTYKTVMHGFSTRLSEDEAESLRTQQGILFVFPEKIYTTHTTRTPLFLGIDKYQELIPEATDGTTTDVVIGMLDTGVWPESRSFNDDGIGPIPTNWKGECQTTKDFTSSCCNRKLIGARYFYKAYEADSGPIDESEESKSPRDDAGHGTHTSTTAAGSAVPDISLFGYAAGTARGMSLRARVAAYKVCWKGGAQCHPADILAGMEKAVEDGVDILSLSLGGGVSDYHTDSIAIGAFTAMEKGVFVSCSAGNLGPEPGSVTNVAPWITTVGAGTIDRDFPAIISLGNGKNYSGISIIDAKVNQITDKVELVYAGNISTSFYGGSCEDGTLIPEKVAGKIVFCDGGRVEAGIAVKQAGALGMISSSIDHGLDWIAESHVLPASHVGYDDGQEIKAYIFSDPNPTATITSAGTKLGVDPAPLVAAFSSRGPNLITPEILKPDMIGPGVNIIAAWSGAIAPTGLPLDKRRVDYNIISGTSMSCPHVSGLAALLKAAHPDWSPAAIRSALMTTSYSKYQSGTPFLDTATGNASTLFDHGAGHVDVIAALDPGLIYDLKPEDYLYFLCALDYTPDQIQSLARRRNFTCDSTHKYRVSELNYPSFGVASNVTGSIVTHKRTLTNVGSPGSYKASSWITTAQGKKDPVTISIKPATLNFRDVNEKLSYNVTFSTTTMPDGTHAFGRIEWSDGTHTISSPVSVTWRSEFQAGGPAGTGSSSGGSFKSIPVLMRSLVLSLISLKFIIYALPL